MSKTAKHLEGITAGEILLKEFLEPRGISQTALAKMIGVPSNDIGEVISGKRSITLDLSIRLGQFFEINPLFWINLQNTCDTRNAQNLIRKIQKQVKPYAYYVRLKSNPLKSNASKSPAFKKATCS